MILNYVWYLAYGSNMNLDVILNRRCVTPLYALPCFCPGATLTFSVPGIPLLEPAFANIQRVATSQHIQKLHGVAYLVKESDYKRICATEGSFDRFDIGYSDSTIMGNLYPTDFSQPIGKDIRRFNPNSMLQFAPAAVKDYLKPIIQQVDAATSPIDGFQVPMRTLFYSGVSASCQRPPSKRYRNLLVNGAEQHGLNPQYRKWLESLPYQGS